MNHEFLAPDGYVYVRGLGVGGAGDVALAIDEATQQHVAIKRLRVYPPPTEKKLLRFTREMQLLQSCSHPNLLTVYRFGVDASGPWMATEYCKGGTVQDWLTSCSERLPLQSALEVVLPLLRALEYLHRVPLLSSAMTVGVNRSLCGIVHRDIKPANILFSDAERRTVKLADFGLARAFEAAGFSGITDSGAIGGSWEFMSRMQAIDFLHSGPAVDIWATAAVFYYVLTRNTPRQIDRRSDPVVCLRDEPVRPIRTVDPLVPKEVAEVVDAVLLADEFPSPFDARSFALALVDAASRCGVAIAEMPEQASAPAA